MASDKPWSPGFTAEALAEALEGLSLDDFFASSFRILSLRDPEAVVANGLAGVWGLDEPVLTDVSEAYVRETYRMLAKVLERLREYDREALTPERRVSYDVYEWYLDDQVRQEEFIFCDYPVTFFTATAVHQQTLHFFADLHPIAGRADAEAYVARLGRVGLKLDQLIDGLKRREQAGFVPPRFAVEWALPGIRDLARAEATATPYYTALAEGLDALPSLSRSEKRALLNAAETAVAGSILPAYEALAAEVAHLVAIGSSDEGLWQFADGEDYYAYLLRHFTTTDLTAAEIYDLGLAELERIQAEMRAVFSELGYPAGESLPRLFDRVARDGGYVSGDQIRATYEGLIREASGRLGGVFQRRPQADVVVVMGPLTGVYEAPSIDGSRPGRFYAGSDDSREALFAMPTLAYHETIPGHHLQIAYPHDSTLPLFRSFVSFLGYTEGWALYAERLASELGWYEGDPYGDLGRLQAEAFRAARLVVDTGIHSRGWTFDEAVEFFTAETGYDDEDLIDPTEQVARYIVWPGQAPAYYVGRLKMLELREEAMDRLGDEFDLQEFHEVVLGGGSVPLEILERVVRDYIEERLGS